MLGSRENSKPNNNRIYHDFFRQTYFLATGKGHGWYVEGWKGRARIKIVTLVDPEKLSIEISGIASRKKSQNSDEDALRSYNFGIPAGHEYRLRLEMFFAWALYSGKLPKALYNNQITQNK